MIPSPTAVDEITTATRKATEQDRDVGELQW